MTGIAFYFEDNDKDVWSGRPIDLDQWMRLTLQYGYDKIAVIDLSSDQSASFNGNVSVPIEMYTSAEEFMALHGDDKFTVFECPWNESQREKISLWDYHESDERDWHFFGPAGGWGVTDLDSQSRDVELVTVPQANADPGHSIFVATTVGAHMYYKRHL